MDVREKLVELLAEAKRQWQGGTNNLDVRIADHLIANGITVQEWIPSPVGYHCRSRRITDDFYLGG